MQCVIPFAMKFVSFESCHAVFLICSNVIGGCMGSFSPKEINPKTGQYYALDFPIITIADIVNAQKLLIDHL